jgi:DNA-binding transcriptional LysR family regulator
VTQAAISQQIRLLEDRVGGELFRREARHVKLTELGRLYLGLTVGALREMESAFETVRAGAAKCPGRQDHADICLLLAAAEAIPLPASVAFGKPDGHGSGFVEWPV